MHLRPTWTDLATALWQRNLLSTQKSRTCERYAVRWVGDKRRRRESTFVRTRPGTQWDQEQVPCSSSGGRMAISCPRTDTPTSVVEARDGARLGLGLYLVPTSLLGLQRDTTLGSTSTDLIPQGPRTMVGPWGICDTLYERNIQSPPPPLMISSFPIIHLQLEYFINS